MFQPVGSRPPSVYWRRRLVVLASLLAVLALIIVTAKVVFSDGGKKPVAGSAADTSSAGSTPSATGGPGSTTASRSGAPSSTGSRAAGSATGSPSSTASTSAPPKACTAAQLGVAAVVGQSSYKVGDEPRLSIQVTNRGSAPCVQDIADPQIVLTVYNGESRVWGSHDCEVKPGSTLRTLMPSAPVRVTIVWSGLSSQPKCAGNRQRVGAGTYTLYATLNGHQGTAAQFSMN